MTTGVLTIDHRVGPYQAGTYYQKIWTGEDRGQQTQNWEFPLQIRHFEKFSVSWSQGKQQKKSLRGEHNYTMQLQKWNDPTLESGYYTGYTCFYLQGGNMWGPNAQLDLWDANDTNALTEKLRQKINGSSLNLGLTLSQSHKTLHMIADISKRIRKSLHLARIAEIKLQKSLKYANRKKDVTRDRRIKAVYRRRLKNAFDVLAGDNQSMKSNREKVASNELMYVYGIAPLLNDVKGGAEYLAHLHSEPHGATFVVRKTKRLETNYPETDQYPTSCENLSRRQIKAIVSEVDAVELLGLRDIPNMIYENLIYSFVLDWFLPIQSWLTAKSTNRGLKAEFVVSHKHRITVKGCSRPHMNSQFSGTFLTMTRTVVFDIETPMPEFIPLSKAASWQRCTNSVALLVMALSGKTYA